MKPSTARTANRIVDCVAILLIAVWLLLIGLQRVGLWPPAPAATATPTVSPLPTTAGTQTPLPTATETQTPLPTATETQTPLPTATETQTPPAAETDTPAPTATVTLPATRTPAPTRTSTATRTPTPLPTRTATTTPSATRTQTPTPAAIVWLNPPSVSVTLNQTFTLAIQIENVTNLYGLDLGLTFDPARLEVVDADGNAANGVQITPGTFLDVSLGFLAQNWADNAMGQVHYIFSLMYPAAAVSGHGTLARFTFRAKGAGYAPITLSDSALANDQARPIPATWMNGGITVLPWPATHVVQPGDTLLSIAWRYRISPWALLAANHLPSPVLHTGQVLSIPGN